MDGMTQITDKNFKEEVEQEKERIVLVDFGASWCGPCKELGKTLVGMMDEYKDKVKFCYADIKDVGGIAQRYMIMSVPTMIVFKDGKAKGSLFGAQSKYNIVKMFKSMI